MTALTLAAFFNSTSNEPDFEYQLNFTSSATPSGGGFAASASGAETYSIVSAGVTTGAGGDRPEVHSAACHAGLYEVGVLLHLVCGGDCSAVYRWVLPEC